MAQRHRGQHPADAALFAPREHGALRRAVSELSWLLTRGYADVAALKLVGDRHELKRRQRLAVRRAACTDEARADRRARRLAIDQLSERSLWIDGFNAIIGVEAALAGGVIVRGRDGALRDLSSVHGTYRRVEETRRAIELIGACVRAAAPPVRWLLDRPVSNSGRLRAMLDDFAAANGWRWEVELVNAPDRVLAECGGAVASGDAWIIDRAPHWVDLPDAVIASAVPTATIVDLSID